VVEPDIGGYLDSNGVAANNLLDCEVTDDNVLGILNSEGETREDWRC
jgi:hypothetical protein